MNEKLPGSAGPALAAHSKDASTPGPTEASSATGNGADHAAAAETEGSAETGSQLSGQAREAVGRVASAAGKAGQRLSEQGGQTAEQIADFVREQPLVALLATGAVCLVLGVLLGRA